MNDSKLKPFSATLLEMRQEGKKLSDMVKWLREEKGVTVARSTVGDFVLQLEQEEEEKIVFAQIASGGRMNKELDAAYRENPAPTIERLITVSKTLIMSLQVKGASDPKLLSLANSMQQTVLEYLSGKTKARFKERELKLAEEKFFFDASKKCLEKLDELIAIKEKPKVSEQDKIQSIRELLFT